MDEIERARTLAGNGNVEDAYLLLCKKSDEGDELATAELAHWRMRGNFIRRDFGECRRLFGLAVRQGAAEARSPYAALLANGAGGIRREWQAAIDQVRRQDNSSANRQLAVIDRMAIDHDGNAGTEFQPEQLSSSPAAWKFSAFLSAEECAYLIELARPSLKPSVVVHPQTGQLVLDPIRRSSTTSFPFIAEPPALHAINRRIARATQSTYEQGEPTQILAYNPQDEYRPHSDVLPSEPNQRVLTFLIYLNDDYSGGETQFPAAHFSFKGKAGDALLFRNVDATGRADKKAVHAGEPVTSGCKYLLSKWIRLRKIDLTGPSGRPF